MLPRDLKWYKGTCKCDLLSAFWLPVIKQTYLSARITLPKHRQRAMSIIHHKFGIASNKECTAMFSGSSTVRSMNLFSKDSCTHAVQRHADSKEWDDFTLRLHDILRGLFEERTSLYNFPPSCASSSLPCSSRNVACQRSCSCTAMHSQVIEEQICVAGSTMR